MKTLILILIVTVLVLGQPVLADESNPESWDHNNPTYSYQMWTFDTSANPALPEDYANPFGAPILSVSGATWYPGLWRGSGTGSMSFTVQIPNQSDPGSYSFLSMTTTYVTDSGYVQSLSLVPSGNETVSMISHSLSAFLPLGSTYSSVRDSIVWRIQPTATVEDIMIQMNLNGGTFDMHKIEVEAISLPEPGSLLSLGGALAGLLGIVFRRRRQS